MLNLMNFDEMQKCEELPKEYFMLKEFKIKEVADLTINILNKYSSKTKLTKANKVSDYVLFLLREKGVLKPNVQQGFVDTLLCASMIHNIIPITTDNWEEVFKIRKILEEENANFALLPYDIIGAIAATVECQLGHNMPVEVCRPNPSSPNELLSIAIALANKK